MMSFLALRRVMTLLAAGCAVTSVGGCGRTLVFAESDGVNLAIRANANSETPVEVNFGLNRAVGSIVPPAGQKKGEPDGEAVNMFAGFELKNNLNPGKIDADLTVQTQFASGAAAAEVANHPRIVAQIVNPRPVALSMTNSAKEYRAWLAPDNNLSTRRYGEVQKWLNNKYTDPKNKVRPIDLANYDQYEEDRVEVLRELRDLKNIPIK